MLIYDNSDIPSLIFQKDDMCMECVPNEFWSEADLRKLLKA